MKIFIQWATDPKSEPEEVDSSDWNTLPKKRDPTGTTPIIDKSKGWIQSLSVMGITFKSDHYSISENPAGYQAGSIKVTFWNDSGTNEDNKHAGIWYMQTLTLRDGQWQPRLWEERFYSPRLQTKLLTDGTLPIFCGTRKVRISNYTDFVPPVEADTRHGVQINDLLNTEYELEKDHSYKEWV